MIPSNIKALIIDMDGVVWKADEPIGDLPEIFARIRARGINFEKIVEATLLVRSGIPFYTTNTDRTFPTPRGEIPGSGAWVSVITTATNIEPIIAGKPFPYLMELSLERLGTTKEETLVVG